MLGEDKPSIAPPPNLICLIKTTYTSPKSSLKPAFLAASWAASKLSFSSLFHLRNSHYAIILIIEIRTLKTKQLNRFYSLKTQFYSILSNLKRFFVLDIHRLKSSFRFKF